jgi:uncharacterized RDD family membrane protein YckC
MTDGDASTWGAHRGGRVSKVPPEARGFQGQRAGFITRLLANLVDLGVVAAILVVVYWGWVLLLFVFSPGGFSPPDLPFGGLLAGAAAVGWLYLTASWSGTGRTFGARVMGIRVVGFHGRVMRLPGAAARAALCLAFMPGLLWVILSTENRSLQDTVIRTSVIHDWTKRPPTREPGRSHLSGG